MPEFSGENLEVTFWLERISAVQEVYQVPNDIMQVIVIGKLIDNAKDWYNSKLDHLMMNWVSLRDELKKMFSCHQDLVILSKNFERRRWKVVEKFSIYFHDKVTLGNNAGMSEYELIHYIIDGFDNKMLQSQARMMLHEIRSLEDLFSRMNNVAKESTRDNNNFNKPTNQFRSF